MSRVLIIGYGNCLRGDDGLGWVAAEQLQTRLQHPDLEFYIAQQLYPEMAALLHNAAHAILIDASAEGVAGQITCYHLSPLATSSSALVHVLAPQQLLAWTYAVYGRIPDTYLYTVTGAEFDFLDALSPAAQFTLPILINEIEVLCHQLIELKE